MSDIWVPILIALVAAAGSVVAVVVASRSSAAVKDAELKSARIQDLENRLSASKAEVYEPMVETLRAVLDSAGTEEELSEEETLDTLRRFSAWVQIYGNDEAVRAFHRFMQAAYSEPPPVVVMRFYVETILAIRRDIGYPESTLDAMDILGIRIKDAYSGEWAAQMIAPLPEFYRMAGWVPPWGDRYG